MVKRILIVEDNELNLKLFRDLLEVHGYEVHDTRDPSLVVQTTRRVMPDLILMDIQLPNASGIDLVVDIKAEPDLRHIVVIAVTAFVMRDDKERMLSAGFAAYIPKPIAIDSFLKMIEQFLP